MVHERRCGSKRQPCSEKDEEVGKAAASRRTPKKTLRKVEEAQAGEAEFFEQALLEVLLFDQGELLGFHFAAVGGKGAVHLATQA